MKRALPSVLVPGLDLGVGQVELGRQFHAVLHAQVLLPFEALLKRLQLMVGERRPGFPLFLAEIRTGIPAVVISVTCTHTQNAENALAIFNRYRSICMYTVVNTGRDIITRFIKRYRCDACA